MSERAQGKSAESSYWGSISGPDVAVSEELAEAIREAEKAFGCPVWTLIHANMDSSINYRMYAGFLQHLDELRPCKSTGGIVLIVDSLGGSPDDAYRIAMLLRRSCGQVRVIVPRIAASAATFFALGADELYLGQEAELGPIDLKVKRGPLGQERAVIDEVQALDYLHQAARGQIEKTISELRRILEIHGMELSLPDALSFVTELMKPLLGKIDAVHYTEASRKLTITEHYAVRLLLRKYGPDRAQEIAHSAVNYYPSHEFVIAYEEAGEILDLDLVEPTEEQQAVLDKLCLILTKGHDVMIGTLIDSREQEQDATPAD